MLLLDVAIGSDRLTDPVVLAEVTSENDVRIELVVVDEDAGVVAVDAVLFPEGKIPAPVCEVSILAFPPGRFDDFAPLRFRLPELAEGDGKNDGLNPDSTYDCAKADCTKALCIQPINCC